MKSNLLFTSLLLILFLILASSINGEQVFHLNHSSERFTEIEFFLGDYELVINDIDGEEYHRLYHPEATFLMEEGLPELPFFTVTIAVPDRGTVFFEEITVLESERISGLNIFPSQGDNREICTERGFLKDADFYTGDIGYPAHLAIISRPAIVRDFRFVTVAVTPFYYNPASSELEVNRHLRLRIENDKATAGENELIRPQHKISRSFENIYRSLFLNYDDIRDPSWEYQARSILVVSHPSMIIRPIVEEFVSWKRDKGFEIVAYYPIYWPPTIYQYILNAYNTWEHPPEYVILIGGGTGSLSLPYYSSPLPGDHPYSLLEGDDDIPDVFVGRFPIADLEQLATIWNKIKHYEKIPYLTDTDWYQHSLLVGDSTSMLGISPKFAMKYIKQLMENYNEEYIFTEHYGTGQSTIIENAFNQGIGFFPYLGFYDVGWWPPEENLNNGFMLPNCFYLGLNTLTYNNNSRTERIVNMGTPTNPKGGIAAIGMSGSNDNVSMFCSLAGSFFYGIFNEGIRTMGETLVRGKIFLHQTYGIVHPSVIPLQTQRTNLMGDPSMDIWVDIPKVMNVGYEEELPLGRNYLDFVVTDGNNQPLKDAWVTIRQVVDNEETLFTTGYTDFNGEITHLFDSGSSGEIKVTVTKPDYIPHLGSFEISETPSVSFHELIMTASFEAGTSAPFLLTVKNHGSDPVLGIEGTITSDNPYVEIIEGTSYYGNIAPGSTSESITTYNVLLSQSAPDFMPLIFTLTLTDNAGNNWTSKFSEMVNGSNLQPTAILVGTENNGYLESGETAILRVTITNNGQIDLEGIYGSLRTLNPQLIIADSLAYFGNVEAGDSVTSTEDNSFLVTASDYLITGMNVELKLSLFNDSGFESVRSITLPIGLVTVTDPLGPCDYGYYIYGMEDVGYEHAPLYEWIEIAPQSGGPGVNTGLTSDWNNMQNVITMDLPFTFTFYGVDYDEISISANGWISFGIVESGYFHNYHLPGPIGPLPIIAPFWDNLNLQSGGVYTCYSQEMDAFIVQWQNAVIPGNHPNTFQIILFNPEAVEDMVDGLIKIQYHTFNNFNSGTIFNDWSNFCTIGIGDHTGNVGLTYTFADQYPTAAETITDESAIMIVGPRTIETGINTPSIVKYLLYQNYPNPFNPVTTISFSIPQQERVTLKIYNIKGELVRTIVDDILPAGNHAAQWYGDNERNRRVVSGIYFYRIEAGNFSEVKKALLLK